MELDQIVNISCSCIIYKQFGDACFNNDRKTTNIYIKDIQKIVKACLDKT